MAKFVTLTSALVAAAMTEFSSAFVPSAQNCALPSKSALLAVPDRREVLGNFAKALGAGVLATASATQISGNDTPELLAGLSNPALETFKAKNKGQSFYPGKGMRAHEDQLVAGLNNPALETFKAKNKGQSFYPGKGMRAHESFDELC